MKNVLRDATAYVTGGRRGLGRAYAEALVLRGAHVHLTGRDVTELVPTCDALSELALAHGTASLVHAHAYTLGDAESEARMAEAFKAHPPDVLVHAAHAFHPHQPIAALKPAPFAEGLRVNVAGAYALLRMAARVMARRGGGRILVVGSLASVTGGFAQAGYVTEKAALEGLVRAIASELASKGVIANIVHPGIVRTENVEARIDGRIAAAYAARTVAGRLLEPAEVAAATLHMVDPAIAAITGQAIVLSGGAHMPFSRGDAE